MAAAVESFARAGYNGASTREIAQMASVNEVTIYRYYAHKRDLFIAAVEYELRRARVRPELLRTLAKAPDPERALALAFELLTALVVNRPALVRLLQFTVLEFGPEMKPLYNGSLAQLIDAAAEALQRWSDCGALCAMDTHATVLSFVATVVMFQDFYSVLARKPLPFESVENAAKAYANLWYGLLRGNGGNGHGTGNLPTEHPPIGAPARPSRTHA